MNTAFLLKDKVAANLANEGHFFFNLSCSSKFQHTVLSNMQNFLTGQSIMSALSDTAE